MLTMNKALYVPDADKNENIKSNFRFQGLETCARSHSETGE